MKKKSTQRIASWLLAAGMMAGTFAQPMAVYAESTASIAASDSTTGDSITADADVVVATPTPEPDTGTDTAATPVPTADSQTPQDPASTAAPETTPAPDAAEDVPTPTPTPAAEDTADDAADTDDTTDTTTTVTPADLQSCIALLAASQLSLDADSIEPDVREETLALSDEITETEPSTLQAVVNAAVYKAPADQTVVVDVPAGNYTGTLVIPDATIVVKDASGKETNINYTNKNIILNMTNSTLTVPTDAAVGVSVFGSLTIQGGTIKAADGCTATRGVQVQLGSALTLDGTTISDFTYAGPGAGVYVKGTAAVDTNGQFDVALGANQEPLQNADNTYQFKKLRRENDAEMDTSFTMQGGATITNCKSDGNGAALYVHNAALLTLENANFTTNNAGGFGGAVYLGTGVQTTIGKGVTFTGNHAAKDGGALYLANQYTLHVKADNILVQVPVTFNGGTFTDNSTDTYGGALAFDPAFDGLAGDTIENVTFGKAETTTSEEGDAEEETTLHGNYAALRGGAIAFNSNIKENTLKNCTFRGNTALRYAGAVYYPNTYGKTTEFKPVYTVEGCTFDRNSATYDVKNGDDAGGGAILIQVNPVSKPDTTQWAKLYVKGSTFTQNTATGYGGAISTRREAGNANAYIYINVDGSTFNGNRTTSAGDTNWRGGGAAFIDSYATADFTANAFTGNYSARFGGAIAFHADNNYKDRVITLGALKDDGTVDQAKGNTFKDNTAANNGGAVNSATNYYGDSTVSIYTSVHIYGGSFENNTTNWGLGGALFAASGNQREDLGLEVVGTAFAGNQAIHSAGAGAVYLYGITSSFKDCKFTANSTEQTHGGAMYIQRTKRFDMDNVTFTGNTAGAVRNDGWGGAIFINEIPSSLGATFTWNGVTFEDNTSRSHGGAVGINTNVYLTLNATNITASNNKSISQSGGAFYLSQGHYTLTDAVFKNNIASNSGGAIYVWNQYSGNSLTINGNSSFTGNTAGSSGGAVCFSDNQYELYTDEAGVKHYYHGSLTVTGTEDAPIEFSSNTARNNGGGAIAIGYNTYTTLDYVKIHDNTAGTSGGGIWWGGMGSKGTMTNSKVYGNAANNDGGAIFVNDRFGVDSYKDENDVTHYVRLSDPAEYTIQDCEITDNKVVNAAATGNYGGGGFALHTDVWSETWFGKEDVGTFNLVNTKLANNSSVRNGGAFVANANWKINIISSTIADNTAEKNGGTAYTNSDVNVKGGTIIAGNTAGTNGGAFYVFKRNNNYQLPTLTTEDCEIKNNTAKKGGIAYVSAGASFAMGKKTFPDSNEGVGDVFVEKDAGKVTLPAAEQLEGEYDAWLMDNTPPALETDIANDSSAEHYYTLQGAARVVARLNGLLGSRTGTEYTTLQAALDEAAKKTGTASIDLLADVGEQVTATTVHNPITLNLNGYTLTGKITLTNGQNINAFTLTDEKADDYKAGSAGGVLTGPANGIEMNNGTKSAHNRLILTGKTLTLRNLSRAVNGQDYIDITAKDVTFTGNTDSGIRLNGSYHNIVAEGAVFTKNTGYSIITNGNYSTVALKDVEIYDNSGTNSGRVYVNSNSTVTVDGGEFHDNITTSQSGGVIASVGWTNTITINGGEFYNNKAVNGGVVYLVYTGNVTINDGKFYNNTATSNGGALAAGNLAVILTINDGEFYNNTANNGGAVYMNTDVGLSTLNMTGGEIYNNTANNGGALYIATKAKVTLSAAEGANVGGIIRDNTASQLASNLYLGGAGSSLTVGEKTLLYGGTIAGDVLFAQGGTVNLADTKALYTKDIVGAEDLVWLKNDATTGETVRSETAPAQTIYTLAPAGENTGSYAARIGSDKYFSINQAIKAMEAADAEDAETNTTTIHLLRDQTEDVTINNTKHSPTLNLNGYTLTGKITVSDLNKNTLTFTLTNDNTQADYNKAGNGGTLTAASGNLVYVNNQTSNLQNITVKLQGVTLTGANRGVLAASNTNLVAVDTTFSNNTLTASGAAGAAIGYNDSGTLVATNCTFTNNRVENSHGGAIYMNRATDTATIENCTFTNNYAQSHGGAVYLNAHAITLRGNRFAGNTAKNQGGAVYLVPNANNEKVETAPYGNYDEILQNNTFENNTASGNGGALYIAPPTTTVTTLIDQCTFTNNSTTTGGGGAVYHNQGSLTLGTGNRFEDNKSYGGASGMYVGGNLFSVRDQEGVALEDEYDTRFIHNIAGYGNYNGGSAALQVGGGSTKHMRNMLFDGNIAAYGGTASAIYVGNTGSGEAERQILIDHCRIVNNEAPAYTVYIADTYYLGNRTQITNTVFDNNTIRSDSGDYSVLLVHYGNNLEVSNTSFTNTQGKGRVIRVLGGGDYKNDTNYVPAYSTFDNVTIKDNTNCLYTPVYISNLNENYRDDYARYSVQASTTWSNCVLTNNASKATDNYQGGAFRVEKQLFTMNDCEITGNRGQHGAIVLYGPLNPVGKGEQKLTEVNLNNCKIADNEGGSAGGLWIGGHESHRLTVNLTNCDISNNTSRSTAGGIYAGQLTTLNMNETTVAENTAKTYGGGLYTYGQDDENGNSRVNLINCKITGNTANYGGGIYMARNQKPEKRDQYHYHDFYVANTTHTQTLNITGGTVANNTALANGGGICTDKDDRDTSYSTLIVKVADGTVENNRAQLGQDVYAYKAKADTVLHLPRASAIHDNGRWLNENTSETLKDEAIDYDPIQRTYPLTLSVPKVETEVAQIVKDGKVVGGPYDSLQEAMDAARALLAKDANQKLTVQLLANTNSSTQISQDTNVTLDLAGHTITGIGGKPALTIESDVNIINSNPDEGGTISGTATDGGALLLRNNANVTMTNTTITNSRAAYRGGAVCVDSGSSFTLGQGSTITGCQAGRGGAVYVIDGSFTQADDAVITNCSVFENAAFSACGYGGAVYVAKGSYTLQNGSVTNNSATQNGIIYIANNSGAEFTMTQGKISGNTCKNGTIYQAGGTMTLAGGSITGNTCTESGGGVYQNGGSSLLLGNTNASQDVVISGNKAVNGAGWYINGGNCLMRGGNITGNKATKRGGGVCQSNGTLTVNGGDITTNNAPEGGGLCHSGGTFNFQGGGLYGNIATGDDGGNDVYSTSKNGVMDLIAAAAMDSDKYNVWRDDYYPYTFTQNYHNTSDKIAAEGSEDGGKYLTSTVPNVNNVKLTADYYENSNIEIGSNDMYIYRMSITKQDTGDGEKDHYDAEDGVITAAEVMSGKKTADNVQSVVLTGKTYPLDYDKDAPVDVKTEEALKVTYTDGRTEEIVRPETPVQWTAGCDATKDNALIRSFSTANYIVSLDTKSQALNEQLVGATERLWMRIKVPCESGEISLSGNGKVFKSSYTYYDPESHCQILEGYQDHVIEKKDLGAMNMTMQFSVKVGGMHNGTTVQPTIEAWFDNSSYQLYRTDTNPYDDRVVLDANIMRVSAKAAYNLYVANNPSLRHIGYFDMDTKTEITEQQYNEKRENNPNSNVVYGMMVGYGMSLQLRNQDTSKGLRGIEVPSRDITFDVNMQGGLKFNGKTVYYADGADGGQPVAINPLLWAYKPNESGSYTGYDTRNNTAGINMNWSDEDDDDRSTHYDSKIAMNVDETHSGGTWTALNPNENSTFTRGDGTEVKQTKLTFKVSGYTMRPISKSNDQAYSFSTGYLQMLIPLELDKYDFAQNGGYEGFLQTDMHMAGGKMTMDNVADADLNGVEAELTDKVNGYFNYTDEGILRSYAKNESTYGDNYDNSSTLGMNISRSRGGNASYITKTNYWLGSDGKTVLNDDQNKQLGTNVTGIASKVYMTGNLAFGSEEVTPANNTDKFIYDAQVDQQAEYYYLTAYDVLMKFDPSAMRPATYMVDGVEKPVYKMSQKEVAANLKDVTHISLSDNGYSEWDTTKQLTQNYELTILYAAKATDTPVLEDGSEGKGWQYDCWERADGAGLDDSQPLWEKQPNTRDNGGTADMDKYSFNGMEMTVGSDGATKEIKGLVYYDTLTELEKADHTCVAVLYQIRNCCVRTGRSVEIGHMMEVTKDVSKIGRSYALTMDVRGWTTYRPFYRSATATGSNPGWTRLMDNGTVLTKRSELLYQGLIEGNGEQANAPVSHPLTSVKNSTINWDIGTPTISRITNNYQKTQYSNGYEVGGSHSGYLSGNTVLLATQNATVEIKTTDVAEGNIRQTDYQLDEGQRTVTVQVTPRVTMQSNAKANLEVFDGTTQTDLTLDVKLPQDLTLQEGTLTFDYSNSSYNRGDLTWEAQYQYWDGTTWQNFDFKTDYEQNYVQRPTLLHLTTTITDVKKVLPVLSFKAGIGYPADPDRDIKGENDQDGAWYKNLRIDAEIHTTYEEENVNASLGRTDYTEIKVLRNSKIVVNKTAVSSLVEIGDVLAYDLTYIKEGGVPSDLELCDLLPYNTEKAKTFHGAYGLKSVTVTVQNADGSAINWDTDGITVKYAGTESVAYNSKGVLDRAATMQKAGSGTSLTTKNTKGNSVTFTPDPMPIHKATGTSKLGILYLQLQNLPNAIVKVRVELAVTQTKDDVNALLTDSDDKTVQQSNDTYNNIYFARAGGKNNALLTSPTASIKVRSRSISGLVWMDQNYDGIYTTKLDDTGKKNVGSDKTLAGITVTLVQTKPNTQDENPVYTDDDNSYYAVTDTLGNKVQPVTTKKDGRYTFENLKQGNYRVLFKDSENGYMMEDDSKPVLPFGKLSVTKHDATMGDTSNKTAPQYGTKDGNTLQAAMSGEITLGDAVLTGRDDKTNINAGFYYTELRLAKVWQNIPDAKKAAEAKVNFTLAATQGEEKLEEAVYTLTNNTVSDPAKAAQDASDLTLFGKFVGTGVDFTDDSADERTVRWQTTQGLPLQAENANGPITYTLKQDTVVADGDTWIGNVSFVQKQDTEKVSSGAESDNSVIATRLVAVNTARTYEILIHKLSDVENKELEQAEFTATLQPASPLEKLLGGKVEIKSQQTIQRTGENEETTEIRYRLTDLTAGTYTLAETKAPLGYAKDPVKYKLTITDRDKNGNTLPIITLEDDKGILLYTAVMTLDQETGDYSVDVTAGDGRDTSTASAVMAAGSCLETTEQEQSNLPIRTQISMEITDSYLFSLPFTGGSGMNRSLLQGVAVMALAAAAFAVTAIHRKKKNHS
ncbi:MAG: right-handed parallel beta-helix repeat-containing protein [Subdoligranulum variabile]|nr:right-handed parallel beta-helix repeat-containing protein [Subdoligranulum variabile]